MPETGHSGSWRQFREKVFIDKPKLTQLSGIFAGLFSSNHFLGACTNWSHLSNKAVECLSNNEKENKNDFISRQILYYAARDPTNSWFKGY